ncbi:MAG: hypothetical protein R2705_01945 [Ilumatobacteraceae bacterium]
MTDEGTAETTDERIRFLFGHLDPEVLLEFDPASEEDLAALVVRAFPLPSEEDGQQRDLAYAVRQVVAAQVLQGDPPFVYAAARRLAEDGMPIHRVVDQLSLVQLQQVEMVMALAPTAEEFDVMSVDHQAMEAAHREALDRLPLPDTEALTEALDELVATSGPMPIRDLIDATVERFGEDSDPLLGRMIERVAEHQFDGSAARPTLAMLHPGLVVHVPTLTEGVVLTHRLSEFERGNAVLDATADLCHLYRRDDLHLVEGTPLVWSWSEDAALLQGPEGWLTEFEVGVLVSVRVDSEGLLELATVEEPDSSGEAAADDLLEALRAAYRREQEPDLPLPLGLESLLFSRWSPIPTGFGPRPCRSPSWSSGPGWTARAASSSTTRSCGRPNGGWCSNTRSPGISTTTKHESVRSWRRSRPCGPIGLPPSTPTNPAAPRPCAPRSA